MKNGAFPDNIVNFPIQNQELETAAIVNLKDKILSLRQNLKLNLFAKRVDNIDAFNQAANEIRETIKELNGLIFKHTGGPIKPFGQASLEWRKFIPTRKRDPRAKKDLWAKLAILDCQTSFIQHLCGTDNQIYMKLYPMLPSIFTQIQRFSGTNQEKLEKLLIDITLYFLTSNEVRFESDSPDAPTN